LNQTEVDSGIPLDSFGQETALAYRQSREQDLDIGSAKGAAQDGNETRLAQEPRRIAQPTGSAHG
jgi:hypothetical protein